MSEYKYKYKQVKKYNGKLIFLEHRCCFCNAKCSDYAAKTIHERFCEGARR